MNSTVPLFPPTLKERFQASRWLQVGGLIAIWALAEAVTTAGRLPIPGGVLGLLVLWTLFESRLLSPAWLERGADSLLDHLMLFFVPAMLALVDHPEFLSLLGVKLLFAVLLGTVVVMCGTALVVEAGFRLGTRHASVR